MAPYKSPFPDNFARVWLSYDGNWNSTPGDLDQAGISIRHGASSEGGAADTSSLSFRFKNGDGKYNPRNPSSPLYGKIGRNTRARSTLALGAPFLSGGTGGYVSTPDSAGVSTTGDLDLRWWGQAPFGYVGMDLMQKWAGGSNNSWTLDADANKRLVMWWSPDGTTTKFLQSEVPIPAWASTVALRATLDVDNGAGGHTASFYWAESLDGPWHPLGRPQTGSGVTTTADTTASVLVRTAGGVNMKVYGYEVRHGIDAPPVASFRFDRAVPGFTKSGTILRSNMWYDPVPAGPVEVWATGAPASVGVVQDPVEGKVLETRKLSVSGGSTASPSMGGHHWVPSVGTSWKIAFDVKFEGSGSTSAISLVYRPTGATATTGQVIAVTNLQTYGEWTRVEGTFTTTATAPTASAAFTVAIPSAYDANSRVLMRNVNMAVSSTTDMSVFSGDTANSESRFYYFVGERLKSPSSEYSSVASSTTFADDQGRTWTLSSSATLTNRHTLAVGEVAEWPMDWNTKGAPSVMTDVEANGVSRRLGQGQRALNSPFYNAVMALPASELLAYWPMEDGADADLFGQAAGDYPAYWSGKPTLAGYEGFPGSRPLAKIGRIAGGPGTVIRGKVRHPSGWTVDAVQIRGLISVPTAGIGAERVIWEASFKAGTPSGVARLELWVDATGALKILSYDWEDVLKNDTGYVAFAINGKDIRLSLELTQSGLNVTARLATLEEAGSGLSFLFPTWTGRSLWPISDLIVNPAASVAFEEVAIGHMTVERSVSSLHDISSNIMRSYDGETGESRLRRLVREKGIPIVLVGANGETADMGPQGVDTWLDVARSVEAADGGVLHDDSQNTGLRYRTLHSLGSQPAAVVIPYEDNKIIPFKPVDDDAMIRNRVTVSRPNGSSFTATRETGALSVQEVPAGVGIYEDSRELNIGSDDTAEAMAYWDMHTGTWDEGRYPTMGVDLADPRVMNDPILVRQILAMGVGDRLIIQDPPSWLPPFSVDVLVMGIAYDITPKNVRITWTCIPARPYRMGYYNSDHRYSGSGTVLTSGITTTDTTLNLTLPVGVAWTHADGDYDIIVGGELMTVKNVTGGNVMTVNRSVNGVVKAHSAGASIELAAPSFYAR